MTNIVPLTANGLPAYLQNARFKEAADAINEEVSNFASFPVLSIKGKTWTLKQGDDAKVLKRKDQSGNEIEDEPLQHVEGVLIRINDKARTYYSDGYTVQADTQGAKPTCYSMDGVAPSPYSEKRQADKCAGCQWAAFGTARDEKGNARKGSACSSNARIAIAPVDAIDKPWLLRVPPTSLKPMRDVVDTIRKRQIPYSVLVMRLGFVPEEASPVLTFRPIGMLDEATADKALAAREDSTVKAICGLEERAPRNANPTASPAPAAPVAAPKPSAAEETSSALDDILAGRAPAAQTAPAVPTPSPSPAPAPVVATQVTPVSQADVAVAQPTAGTPPSQPSATVAVAGDDAAMLAELNNMLGGLPDA